MKSNFSKKIAIACVGAAFALSTAGLRADEPKKDDTRTTHHKRMAGKVYAAQAKAADKTLPTKDGRHAQYQPGRSVGGSQGEEYGVLTGSQIPRHYNRHGYTTDTYGDHFIYDQNDIRIQSAASPAQALRAIPGLTVRGGNY